MNRALQRSLTTTAIKSEDTQTHSTLSSVNGAPKSLRTRLLEVGLITGTRLEATRNGSHYLIKLRGDTLLLRAEERVTSSSSADEGERLETFFIALINQLITTFMTITQDRATVIDKSAEQYTSSDEAKTALVVGRPNAGKTASSTV